jgi:2'-5' RNA ligase
MAVRRAYALVCLLKGEVKKYHKSLSKRIALTFSIPCVLDFADPHFTLKGRFRTNKIKQIESLLETFVSKNKRTTIRLEGYGYFENKVVFMRVILSREAKRVFDTLLLELKDIDWMQWEKHDGKERRFHATLAMQKVGPKFKRIWKYLEEYRPKPDFTTEFDNIAILKFQKGRWNVHKKFYFR